MHGAKRGMDHMLVHGKVKFCIRCKIRYNGTKILKLINVLRLKDLAICKDFQMAFKDVKLNGICDQLKNNAYNTDVAVLCFRKRKH